DDVIAALDALAAHPTWGRHADLSRLVLFGWSYGAFLAFHVARRLAARPATRGPTPAMKVGPVVAAGAVSAWLPHYAEAGLLYRNEAHIRVEPEHVRDLLDRITAPL